MPSKHLLEHGPLYKRVELVLPVRRHEWPKPAITAPCPLCASPQTFNMVNDYEQHDEPALRFGARGYVPPDSRCLRLVYRCAGCDSSHRYYLVSVTQQPRRHRGGAVGPPPETETKAVVEKVGQYPPWDINPDPQLEKKLGDDRVDVFKKGLVCESQGYGIGAFAYYRRIVEGMIGELLDDIQQLIPPEGLDAYAEALAAAKSSHRAVDKIEHVKDLLPTTLRPGGHNPLSLLHGALSEGLHRLPDEECLELAGTVREALVFLVHRVSQEKADAAKFKDTVKTLLEREARAGEAEEKRAKKDSPSRRRPD